MRICNIDVEWWCCQCKATLSRKAFTHVWLLQYALQVHPYRIHEALMRPVLNLKTVYVRCWMGNSCQYKMDTVARKRLRGEEDETKNRRKHGHHSEDDGKPEKHSDRSCRTREIRTCSTVAARLLHHKETGNLLFFVFFFLSFVAGHKTGERTRGKERWEMGIITDSRVSLGYSGIDSVSSALRTSFSFQTCSFSCCLRNKQLAHPDSRFMKEGTADGAAYRQRALCSSLVVLFVYLFLFLF